MTKDTLDMSLLVMDMITEPQSLDLAQSRGIHQEKPLARRKPHPKRRDPREKSVDLKDSERDNEGSNGSKKFRIKDSDKSKGHHHNDQMRGL